METAGRVLSFVAPFVDGGYVNLYGRDITDSKQAGRAYPTLTTAASSKPASIRW